MVPVWWPGCVGENVTVSVAVPPAGTLAPAGMIEKTVLDLVKLTGTLILPPFVNSKESGLLLPGNTVPKFRAVGDAANRTPPAV